MGIYKNRASAAKRLSITVTDFRSVDAPAYGPSSSCRDMRGRMANCPEDTSIRSSAKLGVSACHAGGIRHCVKRR